MWQFWLNSHFLPTYCGQKVVVLWLLRKVSYLFGSLTFFGECASFDAADRLFLFHAALFAFGNEPAFTADSAQDAAFNDFLAKALE
jgi:hypothetical protein